MLLQLTVKNLVLIEQLVLELGPGFNVLTGETGAGKSMLVDALGLVLGGRARPDIVRSGAKEAEVEALFELTPGSRAAARLEAAGIPFERELVVRRVVMQEGRSRAYLNGRLGTATQLTELAPDLCDIASQHESVTLTDPATHLEYLDAYGKLAAIREALGVEVDRLGEITRELEAAREAVRGRSEREDLLGFQLKEIDELAPVAGEETTLEHECGRLRHAEKLATVTSSAAERLYDGDEALCDALGRIASDLESISELDGSLAPLARAVESARAELADAARGLARYAEGIEVNPSRLADISERLFRLQKLLRKHGPTTTELLAYRDQIGRELDGLAGVVDRVEELRGDREKVFASAAASARTLSKKRRDAAERLADAVGRELGALGMGRARVVVDVAPIGNGGAESARGELDGSRLTRAGIDRVEILIAPNRGEEPRPLRRIASGGELSRALLAIKRVLAENGPAGLYVFDEVDAGVSGAIAEVIGRSIADVARHRQVLCITHLPQIASLADAHFVVDKKEVRGRTFTEVRRLDAKERVGEVARMIGGVRVGDAARKAAVELLAMRR
jgi:DNA repair protein RecN (Recombination protein N)